MVSSEYSKELAESELESTGDDDLRSIFLIVLDLSMDLEDDLLGER